MKTVKTLFATLVLFLVIGVSAQSQTKMKSPYPVFSVSPVGGVSFPIGKFGDNFKTGPSFGLDLSYRVNKEVGFYAKFGYNIFSNKVADIPKFRIEKKQSTFSVPEVNYLIAKGT